MDERVVKEILSRLDRLEKALSKDGQPDSHVQIKQNFSGPAGGARLLLTRGFFKTKRRLTDVREALAKADYHYGAAQVQTALNRLSKRGGQLVASKERGKKVYVERK